MKKAVAASQERTLDRDTIIREAIQLLNEKGMGHFSMRTLATRLGVSAPTLYWHFSNKAAITQAIGASVFAASVERLPKTDDWREWLRHYGRAHWRVQKTVSFTSLLLMSPALKQEVMIENNIALMRKIGKRFPLKNDAIMKMQGEIQAVVIGWSVFYHSQARDFIIPIFNDDFDGAVFNAIDHVIAGWDLALASD